MLWLLWRCCDGVMVCHVAVFSALFVLVVDVLCVCLSVLVRKLMLEYEMSGARCCVCEVRVGVGLSCMHERPWWVRRLCMGSMRDGTETNVDDGRYVSLFVHACVHVMHVCTVGWMVASWCGDGVVCLCCSAWVCCCMLLIGCCVFNVVFDLFLVWWKRSCNARRVCRVMVGWTIFISKKQSI
jgi:hypothetical protein